jgi:hypothetical protein
MQAMEKQATMIHEFTSDKNFLRRMITILAGIIIPILQLNMCVYIQISFIKE